MHGHKDLRLVSDKTICLIRSAHIFCMVRSGVAFHDVSFKYESYLISRIARSAIKKRPTIK